MKRLLSALFAVAVCTTAPVAAADDEEEDGVDPIDAILDDRFADDPEYLEFQREREEMEANDPDGENQKAWMDLHDREMEWLENKRDEVKAGGGQAEETDQELLEALEAAISEDDDEDEEGGDDDGEGIAEDGADPGAGDADASEDIPKLPTGFVEEAVRNMTLDADAGPDPAAGCR